MSLFGKRSKYNVMNTQKLTLGIDSQQISHFTSIELRHIDSLKEKNDKSLEKAMTNDIIIIAVLLILVFVSVTLNLH